MAKRKHNTPFTAGDAADTLAHSGATVAVSACNNLLYV
jgi:hypothetical protein